MDRIDCIKAAIAVSKVKSLTKASELLGCNISSLSRKISQLEDEFQVTLFHRTTRSIQVSKDGSAILSQLATVLDLYNSIGPSQNNRALKGELKISVPVALGRLLISKHLLKFNQIHHGLKINLILEDKLIDPVNEDIDIALRVGNLKDSSYICKKLSPRKMILAASPDYLKNNSTPQTIDHLKEHKCLGFIFTGKVRPWRFRKLNKKYISFTPATNLQSNDAEVLRDAAIDGFGIVYLLDFILEKAIKEEKLVKINIKKLSNLERPLHLIYKKTKRKDPLITEFINFLEVFLK